jgi:predicted ATPase
MTRLSAIELTKWRAFERTQRVELRPLTLFFGWNNSGKSALLRALPIIADSVRSDSITPLNLAGRAARDASFRDVSWPRARSRGCTSNTSHGRILRGNRCTGSAF